MAALGMSVRGPGGCAVGATAAPATPSMIVSASARLMDFLLYQAVARPRAILGRFGPSISLVGRLACSRPGWAATGDGVAGFKGPFALGSVAGAPLSEMMTPLVLWSSTPTTRNWSAIRQPLWAIG